MAIRLGDAFAIGEDPRIAPNQIILDRNELNDVSRLIVTSILVPDADSAGPQIVNGGF